MDAAAGHVPWQCAIGRSEAFGGQVRCGMDVSGGYVYETSHIRYSFKAARGGYDGSVALHAGEGGKLSKAADFQRGKSVEEYRESYTSTARAYIMPVIVEALSLVAVCAVTFWLMRRAA